MTFDARFIAVALSTFAVSNLAACAAVAVLFRFRAAAPGMRADDLRQLRRLPALIAAFSMALSAASFFFFEPREQETMGIVLLSLAGLSSALLVAAGVKLAWLLHAARRAEREWLAHAEPIALEGWSGPAFAVASAFPIVAVIGMRRPRLVVARSVLAACTPDELRAIVAHERGHVTRRDNAGRLLFAVTPDLLSWLPGASRMAAAWHDAAENAADDCAASLGEHGRVALAEALIRVARLTPASLPMPAILPASALYRGENIERRVRRLVSPLPAPVPALSRRQRALTSLAVVAACALALHGVYEVLEAAVTFLP